MKTVKKLSFLLAILMMVSCVVPFAAVADGESVTTVGYSAANITYLTDAEIEAMINIKDVSTNADIIANKKMKITDVEGLLHFASLVNNKVHDNTTSGELDFNGKTVYLVADLDLTDVTWTPIGYWTSDSDLARFRGTFDGQGHIIDNLKDTDGDSNYNTKGLFGHTCYGTVKNLILGSGCEFSYSNLSGDKRVGAFVGYGEYVTNIINCYNMATVKANLGNVGGMIGHWWARGNTTGIKITNCTNIE